ncbi:hypothetical protein HNY73_018873 [Argiope bruennichi]|uniref:Uncharacterized protein n=1 Tax=Argiope bruennichi TaxID=94029 RepID=A0A8T0EEX5_ARGBR|nr:hypothetical protein HNY73_018873 [Argiope bruennichi]
MKKKIKSAILLIAVSVSVIKTDAFLDLAVIGVNRIFDAVRKHEIQKQNPPSNKDDSIRHLLYTPSNRNEPCLIQPDPKQVDSIDRVELKARKESLELQEPSNQCLEREFSSCKVRRVDLQFDGNSPYLQPGITNDEVSESPAQRYGFRTRAASDVTHARSPRMSYLSVSVDEVILTKTSPPLPSYPTRGIDVHRCYRLRPPLSEPAPYRLIIVRVTKLVAAKSASVLLTS